jgi:hypothetical protein
MEKGIADDDQSSDHVQPALPPGASEARALLICGFKKDPRRGRLPDGTDELLKATIEPMDDPFGNRIELMEP